MLHQANPGFKRCLLTAAVAAPGGWTHEPVRLCAAATAACLAWVDLVIWLWCLGFDSWFVGAAAKQRVSQLPCVCAGGPCGRASSALRICWISHALGCCVVPVVCARQAVCNSQMCQTGVCEPGNKCSCGGGGCWPWFTPWSSLAVAGSDPVHVQCAGRR